MSYAKARQLREWLEKETLGVEKENTEILPTGGDKPKRGRKRKEV